MANTRSSLISKYGNEAKVYFGLRDLGYTHKATCAMMGNIKQESGFRTEAISYDGYGSVGICQWTGGRKTNLINFAKNHNMSYLNIDCQVKFLDYELRNSEKASREVLLNNSLSVVEMTEQFEKKFERAGVPMMSNRTSAAQTYYTRYQGVGGNAPRQKVSDVLNTIAIKFSHPTKSGSNWPGGSPTKDFKEAWDEVTKDRKSWWGSWAAVGASCDCFVATVCRASGYDKSFPFGLSDQYQDYLPNSKKWKLIPQNSDNTYTPDMLQPGDIVFYKKNGRSGHIQMIVSENKVKKIANASARAHYGFRKAFPTRQFYQLGTQWKFIRAYRATAEYMDSDIDALSSESGYDIDFNKTTSTLSSSDNFAYLSKEEEEKKQATQSETQGKALAETFRAALEKLNVTLSNYTVPSIESTIQEFNALSNTPPKKSTFGGKVNGSVLPIYKTIVEAPFIEVKIKGVTFGTYHRAKALNSYPNYVQSLDITKTNGTLNEYIIHLIHQISPGDNPNYIAGILSNVGFNKIKISYGDANSGKYFSDVEALVTDVRTSFDFSNCNIRYTIYASSLSYLTASTKLNFPATVAKPSSVIVNLLKNNSELIKDYFSGMTNVNKVLSKGLIPTNDAEVEISSVSNKTLTEYLTYLVSLMKNENAKLADKSTYYLSINDDVSFSDGNTFSIKEVTSDVSKINELVYEVNLGYPDDNMAFDFSVNTNYAWAAAMETNSHMTSYKYEIDNFGNVTRNLGNNLIKLTGNASDFMIDNNTWKQLTRFPLSATLTVKGLVAPIMLLTYVKVNNYYYGNKRITSGLYIVTEQKDSISGNGCRTTLGLTRVASDIESLTVDGRVKT